jgi:hypothetical protein
MKPLRFSKNLVLYAIATLFGIALLFWEIGRCALVWVRNVWQES